MTTSVKKREDSELLKMSTAPSLPSIGVYEDEESYDIVSSSTLGGKQSLDKGSVVEFTIVDGAVDLDDEHHVEDFIDPVYESDFDVSEADRLITLVKGTTLDQDITEADRLIAIVEQNAPDVQSNGAQIKSTTITDDNAVREAKRRRKKLLKNLKAIGKLREFEAAGEVLNNEQREKVTRESEWLVELESLEHNLM